MTEEEKIICKQFLDDADKTHSCNEYKLLMALLEHTSTTKNDLGVDCVARQDIERYIEGFINEYTPKKELEFINLELDGLKHLPSVTPQEPVLDKIRAEIKKSSHGKWYVGRLDGKTEEVLLLDEVLQIIDKHISGK